MAKKRTNETARQCTLKAPQFSCHFFGAGGGLHEFDRHRAACRTRGGGTEENVRQPGSREMMIVMMMIDDDGKRTWARHWMARRRVGLPYPGDAQLHMLHGCHMQCGCHTSRDVCTAVREERIRNMVPSAALRARSSPRPPRALAGTCETQVLAGRATRQLFGAYSAAATVQRSSPGQLSWGGK